jgi:hypothetical protein
MKNAILLIVGLALVFIGVKSNAFAVSFLGGFLVGWNATSLYMKAQK